jgi:chromosome segregation ATPase
MTVTKDDLHALDQRINDHKLEVYKAMTEAVAGPMTRLSEEIKEMTGEFRSVKESTGRLSASIEKTDAKVFSLEDKQNKMLIDIMELQTNQKNSKNFWDKFGVPIMLIVFVGLSAINYLKVTP